MENNTINKLFNKLQGEFDVKLPSESHKNNFLKKLEAQNNQTIASTTKKPSYLKPFLSIAASIILIITLSVTLNKNSKTKGLASVSQEMATTQNFFTLTINEELKKINKNRTPETELIINDALKQLNSLEKKYKQLKTDLTTSGNDKRVIHAMIANFSTRVELLKSVLKHIENTKQLKQNSNEKNTTI